jgi:hypothetical protein
MDKGYSGHRPRLQLFHGDADGTITYKNLAEAIKEWTNVLDLSTTPTSTQDTGLTLGTHQAKRQTWKNACGYAVLDALTSVGGDHGPSDALFEASYVIPFLGLDKTDAVDPEIAQCGGGSDGGVGGASGDGAVGGAGGTGGSTSAKDGGVGGSAGGTTGAGGSSANGGSTGSGGSSSTGGASGTGGSQSSGGSAAGGSQASGGAVSTGGKSSTGGSAGSGSGGTSSNGGAAGNSTGGGGTNGCTCSVGSANANGHVGIILLALGLALTTIARRRRGKP